MIETDREVDIETEIDAEAEVETEADGGTADGGSDAEAEAGVGSGVPAGVAADVAASDHVGSDAAEADALDGDAVGSDAVEGETVVIAATDGDAVESSVVEGSAVESGAVEAGAVGSDAAGGASVEDDSIDQPAEPDEAEEQFALDLDPARLGSALESILLVVDTPATPLDLARAVQRPTAEVEAALRALADDYDAAGRGISLREVAGGWRMYTREEFAAYVERFVLDGQKARLSQAALETLAVIAYQQPVTRSRVSAIRGVGVDGVIRTLLTRGLIVEDGADTETGGGLYRTTSLFLERLGLNSLGELPPLAPLLPDVGPNADEHLDAATAEQLADLVDDGVDSDADDPA